MADRDLNHLYPDFRAKVVAIIDELNQWCAVHKVGYQAMLVEGFRSAEYQHSLWLQGRNSAGEIVDKGKVVTYKDGFKKPSNHQTGMAADLVPRKGDSIDWDDNGFFGYLQHLAHVHGLTSGADWMKFKDMDHIEWPTVDKATYAKAEAWKKQSHLS